jgi:hypothetical protein
VKGNTVSKHHVTKAYRGRGAEHTPINIDTRSGVGKSRLFEILKMFLIIRTFTSVEAKNFSSSLWGPPSLLCSGTGGRFPGVKRGRSVTLNTYPSFYCRGQEWVGVILLSLVACMAVTGQLYLLLLSHTYLIQQYFNFKLETRLDFRFSRRQARRLQPSGISGFVVSLE